jgi:hypothetical protein
VLCTCGAWVSRLENEALLLFSAKPLENLSRTKEFCIAENLDCVCFGVFLTTVPQKLRKKRNEPDFARILDGVLKKYFCRRMRCVEEGVEFEDRKIRFKVMACWPRQGFVAKGTRIMLTSALSIEPVKVVEVVPVAPYVISDEMFDCAFLPFFNEKPVHVHSSQRISVFGLECLVTRTEPKDGFVVAEMTEFSYNEFPAPHITRFSLCPYLEDLPLYVSKQPLAQFIKTILDFYIVLHFKGWKRMVKLGQIIEIAGVDFKVTLCEPNIGIVDEESVLFYNGGIVSRRRNITSLQEVQEIRSIVEEFEEEFKKTIENINNIPVFVMEKMQDECENRECIICLNGFEIGDKIRSLPCCKINLGHLFHKRCCDRWLVRNHTCPICKMNII